MLYCTQPVTEVLCRNFDLTQLLYTYVYAASTPTYRYPLLSYCSTDDPTLRQSYKQYSLSPKIGVCVLHVNDGCMQFQTGVQVRVFHTWYKYYFVLAPLPLCRHAPEGNLVRYVCDFFVIFRAFIISSFDHFWLNDGKPVWTRWSRSRRDPCPLERLASPHSF